MFTVDPLYIDWIPPDLVLIASMLMANLLYVDCWLPPRINSVDCLYVDCLYVDCGSTLHWLQIHSRSTVNSPRSIVLLASTLTVDPLYSDCRSAVNPPRINGLDHLHIDYVSTLHWLQIHSTLTADSPLPPPRICVDLGLIHADCWSSLHWLLITPDLHGSWADLCRL